MNTDNPHTANIFLNPGGGSDTPERAKLLWGNGIIVEFTGPTGAGKTTCCRVFSELLKKKKIHVYQFRDVKNYFYGLRFDAQLRIFLRTFKKHGVSMLQLAWLFMQHSIFGPDSNYRYFKLCLFHTAMEEFVKEIRPDVILLDQWIIQGLWSATIFKTKKYDQLQEALKKFYFQSDYVLYFDADPAIASERIAGRKLHRSRFDAMTADRRFKELKKYDAYLHQLYEQSDCRNKIWFSTLESPEQNALHFLQVLEHSQNGNKPI